MISMSEFVAAGGMETLLKHAICVQVGPVTPDPKQASNYYVDILFSFNKEIPRPYFGEKDLEDTTDPINAHDPPPRSRKIVSIMSDDGPPNSNEVEVVNGPSLSDHDRPMSESYTDDEFAGLASGSIKSDTQQETVFLPDGMWIARTQALSSILKQRESMDKADEEDVTTNIISVHGAVRAIGSWEGSVSNKHDDVSKDIKSGLIPPSTQNPPPVDHCHEETDRPEPGTAEPSPMEHNTDAESEETMGDIPDNSNSPSKLGADFSNKCTPLREFHYKEDHAPDPRNDIANANESKSFSAQDGNAGTNEAPPGCGLLRTSSLKAAVRTLRRSLSRDGKKAQASDTGAEQAPSDAGAGEYVNYSEDVDEIQPNYPQPTRQTRLNAENANPVDIPADLTEKRKPADEHSAKSAGSLFRRTSNLARNMIRKLSSIELRAARRGDGAPEENADGNEDPSRLNKRRSLFRKRSSGKEQTAAQEDEKYVPEPNKFRNRRSLIPGRRQKSQGS